MTMYDPSDYMNPQFWTDEFCVDQTSFKAAPWWKVLLRNLFRRVRCLFNSHEYTSVVKFSSFALRTKGTLYGCPHCRKWKIDA